jgi:hypothetical protein
VVLASVARRSKNTAPSPWAILRRRCGDKSHLLCVMVAAPVAIEICPTSGILNGFESGRRTLGAPNRPGDTGQGRVT